MSARIVTAPYSTIAPALAAAVLLACGGKAVIDVGAGGSSASSSGSASSSSSTSSSSSGTTNCGDPQLSAKYAACTAAQDQSACLAAGGSWQTVGLAPEPECQCPTGQQDCACTSPSDCLSSCVGPMPQMWECHDATGHCAAASIVVGCQCFFDGPGSSQGVCVD